MMNITVLGTASAIPTKDRNVTSVFLRFKGLGILFDCGEGTQRQMNLTGIKRTDVDIIALTHWHGDHVGGLIPLIQTMGNSEDGKRLTIIGPKGTKEFMHHALKSCAFESTVDIIVEEIDPKETSVVLETSEYVLETAPLDHSTPCVGYAFTEKARLNINKEALSKLNIPDGPHCRILKEGKDAQYAGKVLRAKDLTYTVEKKKFVFITDTRICKSAVELARDADLLLCEATFANEHKNRALESKHMIAAESAKIANDAGVKKLVLTHFSQRYATTEQIERDARDVFDNVECAQDFSKYTL
ncbi:ribonuclease Z [Candidatus Woesearchaeota archaeon]|nr:MAG: ribonuclease Z [Candidatus Woesearchaeota archaeon]